MAAGVARMAGSLMPYLQKIISNPNVAGMTASGVAGALPSLMRGDIGGTITGGLTGASLGYGMGTVTKGLIPGAGNLAAGLIGSPANPMTGVVASKIAQAAVPVGTGLATNALLNRGIQNTAGGLGGGMVNSASGIIGYNAVTGEPIMGPAVPPGMGQYGGINPLLNNPYDVVNPAGAESARRLMIQKNAEAMRDAMNVTLPTVRKFSEQAKKDEFERAMAAAGIRQNIATNAQLLANAQLAGLNMGQTGAQQAGNAITSSYNYM